MAFDKYQIEHKSQKIPWRFTNFKESNERDYELKLVVYIYTSY